MISANFPPAIGGPASLVPCLSRKLSQEGHEVIILTRSGKNLPRVQRSEQMIILRAPFVSIREYFKPPVVMINLASLCFFGYLWLCSLRIDAITAHDMNLSAITGVFIKKVKK